MSWPIMFFAAGLGTRMGALTKNRPKPLVEVAGKPLIDHALAFAESPGFGPKVVNLHYRGQMLRDHLRGQDIRFSDETDRLLDTGGGLRTAIPLMGAGPVMTMNTDAVWRGPNPLLALREGWDVQMGALLLLVPPERAVGHKGKGDFFYADDGQLSRGAGLIYTGAQIIDPALMDDITDDVFSLNRVWDIAAAQGKLFGALYDGQWCDVGQPESIPLAEAMRDV